MTAREYFNLREKATMLGGALAGFALPVMFFKQSLPTANNWYEEAGYWAMSTIATAPIALMSAAFGTGVGAGLAVYQKVRRMDKVREKESQLVSK